MNDRKEKNSIEDYYIFENRRGERKIVFLSFVSNRKYTGSYIRILTPPQPSFFAAPSLSITVFPRNTKLGPVT